MDAFSSSELRQLASFFFPEVVHGLPEAADHHKLVHEFLAAAARFGYRPHYLLLVLAGQRPRRYDEIRDVAAGMGIPLVAGGIPVGDYPAGDDRQTGVATTVRIDVDSFSDAELERLVSAIIQVSGDEPLTLVGIRRGSVILELRASLVAIHVVRMNIASVIRTAGLESAAVRLMLPKQVIPETEIRHAALTVPWPYLLALLMESGEETSSARARMRAIFDRDEILHTATAISMDYGYRLRARTQAPRARRSVSHFLFFRDCTVDLRSRVVTHHARGGETRLTSRETALLRAMALADGQELTTGEATEVWNDVPLSIVNYGRSKARLYSALRRLRMKLGRPSIEYDDGCYRLVTISSRY
jgi:hypothetical protein